MARLFRDEGLCTSVAEGTKLVELARKLDGNKGQAVMLVPNNTETMFTFTDEAYLQVLKFSADSTLDKIRVYAYLARDAKMERTTGRKSTIDKLAYLNKV